MGAGKSTYAQDLAEAMRTVHLDLDDWMVTLFQADRPPTDFMRWYAERKVRCLAQIWQVSRALLAAGQDVVLELGLIQKEDRDAFYRQVDETGCGLKVYWLDVPEEVRWQRVQRRNGGTGETFKMIVSEEVFQIANAMWQDLDGSELSERNVEMVIGSVDGSEE